MNIPVSVFVLLVCFMFSGCSFLPPMPYKIDIQQGNVVNQEMVDKLKPGMTKSQVRFVMGTPLIIDIFRDDRWDYRYHLQEGGALIDKGGITIFFEEDKLTYIEGDLAPILPGRSELYPSIPLIPEQDATESIHHDYPDEI